MDQEDSEIDLASFAFQIWKNATEADALATAVSVMGAEKGAALIEKLADTEAILILPKPPHQLIKTSGADKYVR